MQDVKVHALERMLCINNGGMMILTILNIRILVWEVGLLRHYVSWPHPDSGFLHRK